MLSFLQKVHKVRPLSTVEAESLKHLCVSVVQKGLSDDECKVVTQCLKLMVEYEQKIEQRLFHVAFAKLMEFTNVIQRTAISPQIHQMLFSHLLVGLYPYAPHLSSEWFFDIWQ